MQLESYFLLLAISSFTTTTNSIPVVQRHPPEGIKFIRGNYRISLPEPMDFITSLDIYCKWYHQNWWSYYRKLRANAQRNMPIAGITPFGYTDYGDSLDNIPVEAIHGKALPPAPVGYSSRTGLSACSGGCQDIRLTLEWVIAAHIDASLQERAKRRFVFPCPVGTKSEEYEKQSMREVSTPEQAALATMLLQQIEFRTYAKDFERNGDTSSIVTGCRCVPLTPEDIAKREETGAKRLRHAELERARIKRLRKAASGSKKVEDQAPRKDSDEDIVGSSQDNGLDVQVSVSAGTADLLYCLDDFHEQFFDRYSPDQLDSPSLENEALEADFNDFLQASLSIVEGRQHTRGQDQGHSYR